MFLDSCRYRTEERAICGVIQVKQVFVLEENEGRLSEVGNFRFYGAPFHPDAGIDLLRTAGLTDVGIVKFNKDVAPELTERYVTLMGRVP